MKFGVLGFNVREVYFIFARDSQGNNDILLNGHRANWIPAVIHMLADNIDSVTGTLKKKFHLDRKN